MNDLIERTIDTGTEDGLLFSADFKSTENETNVNHIEKHHGFDFPRRDFEIVTTNSMSQEVSDFDQITTTASILIPENYVNRKLLTSLRRQFTNELISLILDEDFEYGIDTKADVLVKNHMRLNPLITKDWLNGTFLENFSKVPVLVGLLRIIARLDYWEIYPVGQTMAVAALSHRKTEVQECGVRAFESWGTVESLKILENLKVSTQWLQEYIDEVVLDLRKEYNVSAHQEN